MTILPRMRMTTVKGHAKGRNNTEGLTQISTQLREWLPKVYCDKTCMNMYKKYPNEFGLWWKT